LPPVRDPPALRSLRLIITNPHQEVESLDLEHDGLG
jgi:hypothetical protein